MERLHWIRQVDQQEAAIDEIERFLWQARARGARLNKGNVGCRRRKQLASLGNLRSTEVDSSHLTRRTNKLGQKARHHPDSATKIGNLHSGFDAGLKKKT